MQLKAVFYEKYLKKLPQLLGHEFVGLRGLPAPDRDPESADGTVEARLWHILLHHIGNNQEGPSLGLDNEIEVKFFDKKKF